MGGLSSTAAAPRDARDPSKAFGYFTLVAAANVIGVRLDVGHRPLPTLVIGALSFPLWLVLTYAFPGYMMIGPRQGPILTRVNGSWFMWVVATQSLAAAAATVAVSTPALPASWPPRRGPMGYRRRVVPDGARPGHRPAPRRRGQHPRIQSHLLDLHGCHRHRRAGRSPDPRPSARLAVLVPTRQPSAGWSSCSGRRDLVGPLLVVFGCGHPIGREPLTYEPTLWSMVFPARMYTVGSASYGKPPIPRPGGHRRRGVVGRRRRLGRRAHGHGPVSATRTR